MLRSHKTQGDIWARQQRPSNAVVDSRLTPQIIVPVQHVVPCVLQALFKLLLGARRPRPALDGTRPLQTQRLVR